MFLRFAAASLCALTLTACVIDRTGRSVTPEGLRRDMALQAMRVQTIQAEMQTFESRIVQLERVARARGQEVILQMESIDQLRQDVSAIRGDIEVVQHRAGMGTDQLSRLQEDADFRLQKLEQRARELEALLGMVEGQPIPQPTVPVTPVSDQESQDDVAFEIHVATAAELAVPTEEEVAASSEEQLLALMRDHISRGLAKPARVVQEQFTARFPDSQHKAELTFLSASSWYGERSYEKAILAFQKVLESHPDSEWAPWALLRQGQCFAALGQEQNTAFFFDDVSALYPKTPAEESAKLLKQGKPLTGEQIGPGLIVAVPVEEVGQPTALEGTSSPDSPQTSDTPGADEPVEESTPSEADQPTVEPEKSSEQP